MEIIGFIVSIPFLHYNLGVFNSIDTILAISVFYNALDTNKTNRELFQRKALNIFEHIGGVDSYVYLPCHQFP